MKYRTILLFGPPGSGKGTWGKVLGNMPGFLHLSSGDMFRNLDTNTEVGALCASYMKKGELVPDDVTVRLSREYIQKLVQSGKFDPEKTWLLLDGLPRNREQAGMMDDILNVRVILSLDCSNRQTLLERLKKRALIEGRKDDADENTIRRRFDVYDAQTADTLSAYSGSLVETVDVSTPIPQILYDIAKVLLARLK